LFFAIRRCSAHCFDSFFYSSAFWFCCAIEREVEIDFVFGCAVLFTASMTISEWRCVVSI